MGSPAGFGSGGGLPPPPPYFNHDPMMMRGTMFPRKRGAAGIIGLGAPGTLPPRNLIKKLTGTVSPGGLPHHTQFDGCRMNGNAGGWFAGNGCYGDAFRGGSSGDPYEP